MESNVLSCGHQVLLDPDFKMDVELDYIVGLDYIGLDSTRLVL